MPAFKVQYSANHVLVVMNALVLIQVQFPAKLGITQRKVLVCVRNARLEKLVEEKMLNPMRAVCQDIILC